MTFNIKQNDTAPSIRANLKDGNAAAVNLTGASVRFHMRTISGGISKVDAPGVIISPPDSGVVQYNWNAADTDTVESYQAEFEITYANGTIETFPNDRYIRIEITDDIS